MITKKEVKELSEMKIEDRIYYTGDRANIDGWGSITNIKNDGHVLYTITLDDGRIFRALQSDMFEEYPGQRFKTKTQIKKKQEQMLSFYKEMKKKNSNKENTIK